jgi:hypothetical protein
MVVAMRLGDVWEEYKDLTKDLTETGRKLGFAAAAICWFFKTPEVTFPYHIYISLLFIVGFFSCDILQLLLGSQIYRFWCIYQQNQIINGKKELTPDCEVEKPYWINWPANTFFLLKIFFLLCSYFTISIEFYNHIK